MARLGDMARGWGDVAGAFAQDAREHKRPQSSKVRLQRPERPAVWLLMLQGQVFDVIVGTSSDARAFSSEWGGIPRKASADEARVLQRAGQLDNL